MIYLLEDDDSIRKLVVYTLESQGYKAEGFARPSAFWRALDVNTPELILLDIMLPEEDGLSILRRLRDSGSTKNVPVIMLTAKNTEYDRVIGLDNGADDFISKPFGMMELVARVRAVLRRIQPVVDTAADFAIGELYVCPAKHIVTVAGEDVSLTHKEFELLCLLLDNRGRVLTREVIMDKIWDSDFDRENRTVDVHVRTLRSKLGDAGSCIETVRGVGYKIGESK